MRAPSPGLVLSLLALLLAAAAHGQPWSFRYGGVDADLGYEVTPTADGGFVTVGFTSQVSRVDAFVVRAEADGTARWQRVLSLSPLSERFFDVVPTADGGFVVIGSADVPGTPDYRPWLVKLDADGDEVWNTSDGLTLDLDVDSGIVRGVELANGDLAVVGGSNTFTDTQDPWVAIVDAAGQVKSFQVYPTLGTPGFGVATYVNDLAATPDGGFVATGYVSGGLGFAYLWKLDAGGVPQWDRLYQGVGFRAADAVTPLAGGGFALVGCELPNCTDTAVLWADAEGQVVRFQVYEDAGGEQTLGRDALERADGSLLVAQIRYSAAGARFFAADLLELDPQGQLRDVIPIDVGQTSTTLYRLSPDGPGGALLGVGTVNDSSDPDDIDLLVVRDALPSPAFVFADGFEAGHAGSWSMAVNLVD